MSNLGRLRELLQFDNRWQLIAERLLFRGTHLQVHRINGVEMIVDHRGADAGSIRTCVAGTMYRRFVAQMKLGQCLTVADFGANVGGFSCLLKVLQLDVDRLLCLEMNPNTYERLRFNICTNFSLNNTSVINAAVCGEPRQIPLSLGVGSTGDNIYFGHRGEQDKVLHTVEGRTFDDLCDKYLPGGMIDICKMDVEGAEAELLRYSSHSVNSLNRCRYFLIEMHPVDHYAEMCDVLKRHGFTLVDHEGKQMRGVHLFKNSRIE